MSTVSYSTDLRKRVIDHVSAGNSQKPAAELFSISTTTVFTWWNIYNKEGRTSALPRGGSKGKVGKQALQKFVHRHPDSTLKQLGEHFGVTASSIGSLLKKLRYSYKKNVCIFRSPPCKTPAIQG